MSTATSNIAKSQLYERADTQKKTFAKWINYILKKGGRDTEVVDIINDLQDGTVLLALLEVITGKKLRQEKGRMRVHKINNVNRSLEVLQGYDTKLVNIRSEEIVDGNVKLILGLIWSIIVHFQIKSAMHHSMSGNETSTELEKTLLNWCRQCTQRYKEVDIRNFTSSWRDGLAFNAILHHHRPDLFNYQKLLGRPPNDNLAHAFQQAKNSLRTAALLDPEDVNTDHPDKKSIIMYLTTLYEVLSGQKEMAEGSEGSEMEHSATRSDSPTPSSVSTMSEWDDYNETLAQVLTWLLQAETQLKQQEPVSDNVDQVKEQFREHEEFMMILTSHQTSVGSVLEFGSQLINEGIVIGKEEREIRDQMSVLSDRWENLRVSAMQRQSELHQYLMKLQQLQLQELADWLTKAENKMATASSIGSDLETVKRQVEEHKVFQEDLENQQHHVNSLSHMVVVVDESESENATADLEEQLALLGERWSAVCKWTEHRWAHLQEILTSWQKYRNQEQRLSNWLFEKEKSLKEISVIDMGDKNEVQRQIQNLKDLETELTQQQGSFGDFNLAAQRVAQTLEEDSPAIQGIQDTMEDFNQRWNTIASMLNTKMKHLRGMENKLQIFLQELDDNMQWINDTEMLLQPQMNPHKELIESLDQAVNKRRASFMDMKQQGDELMKQTVTAGQSVVGLRQYLNNFNEKWTFLLKMINDRKQSLEFSEKKKVFIDEAQRIIVVVTEITIYVEKIVIELKSQPKEMLIKIESKMKELQSCASALDKLSAECNQVQDPALKSAFKAELTTVMQNVQSVEKFVKEKQDVVTEILQSTPPPEFLEKTMLIQTVIEEVFPFVSKEFKYDEIKKMHTLAEGLKEKLNTLQEQEVTLKLLTQQQKEMLKNLSPENSQKFQKQILDLGRQWADCKKITEVRLQRVNEAVIQTKELETAMKETFHWMDDVDKFLKEITGTIVEGDTETIDSQVQEVEALQQDIATVQKKVDSLIETCTLIMNRSEPDYSVVLNKKLTNLNERWTGIIATTEQQKEHLRNAGLKFQEVDVGVKDIINFLKSLDVDIQNERFNKLEKASLKTKLEEYQEINVQLTLKSSIITEYQEAVRQLISSASTGSDSPPILKDIELASLIFSAVSAKVQDTIKQLTTTKANLDELDVLSANMYRSMELLDSAIAKSSEKLDGNDDELQKCLLVLEEFLKNFSTEDMKSLESLGKQLQDGGICGSAAQNLIDGYKARLDDTKERCKKVQYILEGELMKRQQLRKDLVQITSWLVKVEKDIEDRISGDIDIEDTYTETLHEEISLNEALVSSAERSIKELVSTGKPEHKEIEDQLTNMQSRWDKLLQRFEVLKTQPRSKELESNFTSLDGSILTAIDTLKRKVKQLKLLSPTVHDIQMAVETLEDLTKVCDNINKDINELANIAKELSAKNKGGLLDCQVKEVDDEYNTVKDLLKNKEKLFGDALPLSESVYANFETLDNWLLMITESLQNISMQPLPETPEETIEKLQEIINDITGRGKDIQHFSSNASHLSQMSEEPAFQAMETRVHDVYVAYTELEEMSKDKLDTLEHWVQQLDGYEKKADDWNAWLDGRFSMLESIGGVSAKFDVEMELQKLQGIKSLVSSKEPELDILKASGDDIALKGHSGIVAPFEKQIYERWDKLEQKVNYIESTLKLKLQEIEKVENEPPPEKRRILEEEEVIVDEPINIIEVESAPILGFEDNASIETDIQMVTKQQTMATPTTKKYKPEHKVSFHNNIEQMIIEVETIEENLTELKSGDDIVYMKEHVDELEDALDELQPEFERLMGEANNLFKDVDNNDEKKEPFLKLVRKLSGVHADLAIRKQSLKQADYKFIQLKTDLDTVQVWLDRTEKILQREKDPHRLKDIEDNFEKRVAEMEAVNIRAEQLTDVCSPTLIPKKQIANLNKRFRVVSYQFEEYQRPEEKVTAYKVSVETGDLPDADTRANVYIKLFGEYGNSDQLQLRQSETKRKKFQSGQVDLFTFREQPWLGKLSKLRVWHDNEGTTPAWYLGDIYILDELSGRLFCFVFNTWLSKESGAVLKEIPVSSMTLSKEAGPDVLTKKHCITEIHWLFDAFNTKKDDSALKPCSELILDIKETVRRITEVQDKLENADLTGKPFDNFNREGEILKELELSMNNLNVNVTDFMLIRERYLSQCTPTEMHEIDMNMSGMRSKWNSVNKELKLKFVSYDTKTTLWQTFHNDLSSLSLSLNNFEEQLGENIVNEEHQRDLEANMNEQQQKINSVSLIAHEIISQSSEQDAESLRLKLNALTERWLTLTTEVSNHKMRLLLDDDQLKYYMEQSNIIHNMLNELNEVVFIIKPHPVNEESLEDYLDKLKAGEKQLLMKQSMMDNLKDDAMKILSRTDLSATQLEEIKSRSEAQQQEWQETSVGLGNGKKITEEKLTRATKFLEELEELSVWMSATRDLLEGQKQGKPGFHVDPETMKLALETRKANVESINKLLMEFKAEGELSSGKFPQDVGEKITQLNADWQVIIRLAIALRDQPVTEEVLIVESMQETESEVTIIPHDDFKLNVADYSSTSTFDNNVAQLHDWLTLIEQKLKGLTIVIGDVDDMDSMLQKQTSIQLEMDNRRNDRDETIEMAAALNMESTNESVNYAIDDKVSKLKDHWEVVWEKVVMQRKILDQLMSDYRRFNELRTQLNNWMYKVELQLKENQKIGNTVTELEEQLAKHKVIQEGILVWLGTYNKLRQFSELLLQNYSQHELNDLRTNVNKVNSRWNDLEQRSNARQQSLQDALDRLLLFHKNMISALTWLSSAESKVAELDSLVEASQAEDTADVEELQNEMVELEQDISAHQVMFQGLNETGNQIMMDLEAGEVRTALQSKLDDMNDRWNSLGVRVVDIRDRMSDGTGEWRQLLLDMQEIIDWLIRADQELMSQQPVGADIAIVHQQNENHQAFKGKLKVRRVVIEQALEQGHNFLLKHEAHDSNFMARSNNNLVVRVASNLQKQLAHVESQWQELMNNSNKWQQTMDVILELVEQLQPEIKVITAKLDDAEQVKSRWLPTSEMIVDNIHVHLDEIKSFNENIGSLEPLFDNMDGTVKELKHIHDYTLPSEMESVVEQLHTRWRALHSDCHQRQQNLQGLMGDLDNQGGSPLQGSVGPPWERGQALNKVPYFINHDTKTTQWDHPKMTGLYHTLSELNEVKYAAYRTSMKLRCIQKACCLDLVDMDNVVTNAFDQHGLRTNNENLIDVGEIISVLLTIFENVEKRRKEAISVLQCVDMTLNWLLNVYDSGRIGKVRILSFKIGIVLMCRAKLEDKWKYLFRQIADPTGHADSKKLGLLLHDCVQIPRQLGEIAAFGGSNIEPSVRSCFKKADTDTSKFIDASNFTDWTGAEPQSLVWMPVLHRLAAAETAKHEAKCNICKEYPIVGFRYRCLKCFNYDLCQSCFWSGRKSKSHRITHPMHQYSLATTTGEDMSDFVKLMKNKFKSRRYRSRPPKKLGYLPVQTIMEGSSIETPSIPSTPDTSFSFSTANGSGSPESTRYQIEEMTEEHRLIQQMCQSLNGDMNTLSHTPKSPTQILASIDLEQKQDINEMIHGLEEEHQALEEEYNRLKGISANGTDTTDGQSPSARDTELIAEAKILRQHKGRLEARMQILEDHNRQLEAQLQRLRQLLEQSPSERERAAINIQSPPSPSRVTPALTPSSSYHGSPELDRRNMMNGYSNENAIDIRQVTTQIEHAFPVE